MWTSYHLGALKIVAHIYRLFVKDSLKFYVLILFDIVFSMIHFDRKKQTATCGLLDFAIVRRQLSGCIGVANHIYDTVRCATCNSKFSLRPSVRAVEV